MLEARKNQISYRVRYRRPVNFESAPLPVSGYGVELALKRTDYIVIDDRDSQRDAGLQSDGRQAVLDSDEDFADLKPLSTSELASLGLKTASFIMQSDDPFDTLLRLTRDFPKFSSSIAAHDVHEAFLGEHQANRRLFVPSGMNALWMNGVQLIERQIEPFNMIDMLRRERKLINGVQGLGLSSSEAINLLSHRAVTLAKSEDDPMRFDWRDEKEDGRVIIWMNDIETDPQYSEFSPSLRVVRQFPLVSPDSQM